MDDLDRAKELEMQQRDIALKRQQQSHHFDQQHFDEQGHVICLDCGDVLPAARLLAEPKAARCVPCKQALEQQQQHYRRY